MNLRELLPVLRRRWKVVVSVFLLCMAGTVLFTALQPRTYVATSRLFAVVAAQGDASAAEAGQFTQLQLKSLPGLVTSTAVLGPVIESQKMDVTPEELSKRVTASVVVDTLWIDISVQDANAVSSAQIAEAVGRQVVAAWARLNGAPAAHSHLEMVTPPEVPTRATSPVWPINLAAGVVLGLVLSLAAAMLREATLTRLQTPEDIDRHLGVPSLGSVSARAEVAGQVADEVATTICARISLPATLLTVASPGEARVSSQVALRLGAAFANLGHQTAVLDLCGSGIRTPPGAQTLEVADLLSADRLRVGTTGLTVVTPPDDAETLRVVGSTHFEQVLIRLRENCRVVLVAVPSSAGGLPLAANAIVDGAVLVGTPRTSRSDLVATRRLLTEVATPVVGYVSVTSQ